MVLVTPHVIWLNHSRVEVPWNHPLAAPPRRGALADFGDSGDSGDARVAAATLVELGFLFVATEARVLEGDSTTSSRPGPHYATLCAVALRNVFAAVVGRRGRASAPRGELDEWDACEALKAALHGTHRDALAKAMAAPPAGGGVGGTSSDSDSDSPPSVGLLRRAAAFHAALEKLLSRGTKAAALRAVTCLCRLSGRILSDRHSSTPLFAGLARVQGRGHLDPCVVDRPVRERNTTRERESQTTTLSGASKPEPATSRPGTTPG